LRFIVGTEVRLAEGARLVLLATDRVGYGQLCERITRARRRAPKGQYELHRADLESDMSRCLALLLPGTAPDARSAAASRVLPTIDNAHDAHWLAEAFPGRAWVAAELLAGAADRTHLRTLDEMARRARLPLVAAGDVHMHRRSRRMLQDTLTAIRLGVPLDQCGQALFANAERHLRQRMRLAQVYPESLLAETLVVAGRCHFSLDELRYEYPDEIVAAGRTPAQHLRYALNPRPPGRRRHGQQR
jgi:error-prone DNA polymerase